MNRLIRPELIVGILLGLTAQLGGQGGGRMQIAPVITIAVADLDALSPTIFIFGTNFGPSPQVFIGNDIGTLDALVVISSNNTFIEAELVSIDPGTYALEVANGPSTLHVSEMDVTIGAVGPEGPLGPPGTPNPDIITEGAPTFNTAIGVDALLNNTTGFSNTASGARALLNNTTGTSNTASGANALLKNTTGNNNTASGRSSLRSNTTGSGNTASGTGALVNNTTGTGNTASGNAALAGNTSGNTNTASGNAALISNTTGSDNTVSGFAALSRNTTGINNTVSGVAALNGNTTGSGNIALGYRAGSNATTGDNNIFIGNPAVAAESDTIRIDDGGHTDAFIAGVPIVVPSSKRFKEDIRDMGQGSTGLMRLRPVTFRYRKEYDAGDHRLQYGLIAEEVVGVYPELVVHDDTGRVRTVIYQELNVMLLNELQKQHRQIQDLTERLARLEQTLTTRQLLASLKE